MKFSFKLFYCCMIYSHIIYGGMFAACVCDTTVACYCVCFMCCVMMIDYSINLVLCYRLTNNYTKFLELSIINVLFDNVTQHHTLLLDN